MTEGLVVNLETHQQKSAHLKNRKKTEKQGSTRDLWHNSSGPRLCVLGVQKENGNEDKAG